VTVSKHTELSRSNAVVDRRSSLTMHRMSTLDRNDYAIPLPPAGEFGDFKDARLSHRANNLRGTQSQAGKEPAC
jgi:hypothetical protein